MFCTEGFWTGSLVTVEEWSGVNGASSFNKAFIVTVCSFRGVSRCNSLSFAPLSLGALLHVFPVAAHSFPRQFLPRIALFHLGHHW